LRHIQHPGPVAPQRVAAVAGSPVHLRFTLQQGDTVDRAIAKGFAASGCAGGFVAFSDGRFDPFRFLMPAFARDARHAAWYSDTFAPEGSVQIRRGCAIVGIRDGKTFIHCHGIWDTAEGRRMGHMLAPDTFVAEPIEVTGIGLRNATFKSQEDPETNFLLFEPVLVAEGIQPSSKYPVLLAKVRPNEDISVAIEALCTEHGITAAKVYGIGSLNEVRFIDGRSVSSYATELVINDGTVTSAGGKPMARLDIAVVDVEGAISEGEIVRGDNPVCVTFELVIEVLELASNR
jgi:predicted DNA-binding protein with PD1-like motif